MEESNDKTGGEGGFDQFRRRVFFVVAVVVSIVLIVLLRDILLLAFGGLLVAMVLLAVGRLVARATRLSEKASLVVAGFLVLGVMILAGWLAWPIFANELPNLFDRIDEAVDQLENDFGVELPGTVSELAAGFSGWGSQLLSGVVAAVGVIASALSAFILVVVVGVFLAAEPRTYRDGIVLLFPIHLHGRVRRALDKIGTHLQTWLKAQALTMLIVGILTGLGAWAIGLPAPVALGVFAGVGEFIPIVGPIIAAIPALLVAFGEGGSMVIATLLLYLVIQQLEGNVITPLVQREMLSLPPVVLLLSLLVAGLFFGPLGIIVAAPLTVAGFVAVREFYVREYLDEAELIDRRKEMAKPDDD